MASAKQVLTTTAAKRKERPSRENYAAALAAMKRRSYKHSDHEPWSPENQ